MLEQLRPLFERGFSLIWIRPKSKAPLEDKWTERPNKTWEELEKSYREGMNVGVRLGRHSKVDGGYLAVIDCDVKSLDPRHEQEMLRALIKHFPKIRNTPWALSGRGNGSHHCYVLTEAPIKGRRIAESSETVKVQMPSISPSKREIAELTIEELKAGTRLRVAWEISLMGEGRQVVLPPSVHPDSGREYAWAEEGGVAAWKGFERIDEKSTLEPVPAEKISGPQNTPHYAFTPVSVPTVPAAVREILSGEKGSKDRSAALLGAANKLCDFGWTDAQILTVLTDKAWYLGNAAYDHTQSDSRATAAQWLREYTLPKARAYSNVKAFPKIGSGKGEAEGEPWQEDLIRTANGLKSCVENGVVLLKNLAPGLIRYNEFTETILFEKTVPWGYFGHQDMQDEDVTRIRCWLTRISGLELSHDNVWKVVAKIASENTFHPVRDYFDGLKWDGRERLDLWLKTYLGAEEPEEYLRMIGPKVLIASVGRIYAPGMKFDSVLILEGKQGVGKSRTIAALASKDWFCDNLPDLHSKDARLYLAGVLFVELAELVSFKRADSETVKSFLSAQFDRLRPPYGRTTITRRRQCVFIGTTNHAQYFKDRTSNRRFWPVVTGFCDVAAVKRDRDQLFAEAVVRWQLGEECYLTQEQDNWVEENFRQSKMIESDESHIKEILQDLINVGHPLFEGEFKIDDLTKPGEPLQAFPDRGYLRNAIAGELKALGFRKRHSKKGNFWSLF